MPYIKQKLRDRLSDPLIFPENAGELNYKITQLCREYLDINTKKDYNGYNEIVGVLECVKLEYYRRAVAAYEDEKIKENGDVY